MRPPNTAKLFRDWLRTKVSQRVEQVMVADPPASWVRVSQTGGAGWSSQVLWQATLTCECWAPDYAAAWTLASDVCEAAAAWQGTPGPPAVYMSAPGVPREFPDPDTASPRFLVDVTVTLRTLDS